MQLNVCLWVYVLRTLFPSIFIENLHNFLHLTVTLAQLIKRVLLLLVTHFNKLKEHHVI